MRTEPFDVLVVGGGITGAGVALDAASRGLRTALVERTDFAAGTSSRSSKMVHGGLRYLAHLELRLVREALRERAGLRMRAPHLVRDLPMTLPVYGSRMPVQRITAGAGLWLYDLLGGARDAGRHRWLDRAATLDAVPNLAPAGLAGGLAYADAQADDVGLVLAVLRTAAAHGACVANDAAVRSLLERGDRVVGAVVRDGERDAEFEVAARVVVNATGVWADTLQPASAGAPAFDLAPSKGVHLTVARERVGIARGVAFFPQTGYSNVFVEPWRDDLALVGTTDDAYDGARDDPSATEEDIRALLDRLNPLLREPLARDDVIAAWAGLRPLVASRDAHGTSEDLSRDHRTIVSPGLVTLVGGKLTTYRAMAQQGVDAALRTMGEPPRACRTHGLSLDGAGAGAATPDRVAAFADRVGIPVRTADHLLRRYGDRATVVEQLCAQQPELREPLHPDRPYVAAEVVYAAHCEMPRNADDVLHRRTRLAIETRDGGASARQRVTELLASVSETGAPAPG